MNSWFSPRVLFAFGLVFVGAVFAGQMIGAAERILVVFVSMLIALFVVAEGQDHDDAVIDTPRPDEPLVIDAASITSHPQLQAFIDASTDAILMVENARVTAANVVALRLLGSNIVGQNVRMAFRHAGAIERLSDPDAQHSGHPIKLTGIGQQNQLWEMRIQMMGPGQKIVHLADRSGTQAAEKMRVDFVANASHELLTPLAAVKGFIETLDDPAAGDDPATRSRFLGIMATETDRMQALVRDLMSLSRIEAEKYDPPQTPVDFAQIVMETVDQLRNSQKDRGADIAVDITADLPAVIGDAGQLRQLANNILNNAMKYGKDGTPVLVSLVSSRSGAMLNFAVADEGDGIAPEHLPRLTERFYRVDSGRSRLVGGTGLGLSLVKHIVDRHRGHLEIRSTVGKGTTVSILLPVSPA
ncbi:MAG TPA: ATP-binding protein [Sphingorhabdus sp.]|uniref:ATP-binding protein n=1 Tax=Sphingorhabdus sp. TaxID=1902408 RepID=UPI00267F9E61|nr:ATP-binding protein [Sphingorhabdus sp.]HQS12464.1 ATP-binding protein [Sphingorhabdus sp.]HQS79988.1 ATP-binding protein [Sphingorhabdus sp.]